MDGVETKDDLVSSTIAELAFLFLFGMFLYILATDVDVEGERERAFNTELNQIAAQATQELVCGCDVSVKRLRESGDFTLPIICDSQTRFPLFEVNSERGRRFDLTKKGERCFSFLCRETFLLSRQYEDLIDYVAIEGHASSEWEDPVACVDASHCNQKLSSQRSISVYSHCRTSIMSSASAFTPEFQAQLPADAPEEWRSPANWAEYFRRYVGNEGLGSRRPLALGPEAAPTPLHHSDKRNRRVEFRFSVNRND